LAPRDRGDGAAVRHLRLNEFFYAVQLNPVKGSTVPIWVTTNISTRGDFLAKLSAASVLACIPVVLAGWFAQKRMIRGLAMGAIK
jgi:sorbitol/mannitol transport system permease protein